MTTPGSDARLDLPQGPLTGPLIGYRNPYTGEEIDTESSRFNEIHQRELWKQAPPLSPLEQQRAGQALQEMLDTGQLNYPELARTMIQRPETLWLAAEMGFQLNGGEPGNPAANALASESVEAVLYGADTPKLLADYQRDGQIAGVVPRFWGEVGNFFSGDHRDMFVVGLSRLDPDSADRVASRLMIWAKERDMNDPMVQGQALLNFHQLVYSQQQSDLGEQGSNWFMNAIRWPVKHAKLGLEKVISHTNYHLGSPEDAVRRRGLTPGEQVAYQFGLRPKDDFAEMGAWHITSGIVDGAAEIGLDPINVLAGAGVAFKTIKHIPIPANLTKGAKARYAARAFFAPTRRYAGIASDIKGGRFVRTAWVLGGKTFDQMLQTKEALKVVGEVQTLLKQGKRATMIRRFPAFANLPEQALHVITHVDDTPEEAMLTLRMVAMNDALNNPDAIHKAEMALTEAATALRRQKYEALKLKAKYTDEDIALMNTLEDFQPTQVAGRADTGADDVEAVLRATEERASLNDKVLGTFEFAGDSYTVQKIPATAAEQATGFRAGFSASLGQTDTWYVRNSEDIVVGSYNSRSLVGSEPGVMHAALEVSERAGDSFLPVMLRRANSADANFSKDGARFLRNAIENRLGRQTTNLNWLGTAEGLDPITVQRALLQQYRLQAASGKIKQPFFITQAVTAPRRVFSRANFYKLAPGHRGRSAVSRLSPPVGDLREINIADEAQAVKDLGALFEHYGLAPRRVETLLEDFLSVERGARQDWIFTVGLPAIGEDRKVGALSYNLVRLYESGIQRQFSSRGTDLIEVGGKAKRIPIFPHQMSERVPIPIGAIDEIVGRAKRSRAALWPTGRGLGFGKDRLELAERFQRFIKSKYNVDVDPEEAYHMAYSMFSHVNPDARGWAAGKLLPKAGSAWDKQHSFFTLAMLLGRPFQWAFRVNFEEQLRAFINNMPSLGRNPIDWMWGMREAWLLVGMAERRSRAIKAGSHYYTLLTKEVTKADDILGRLREFGIAELIFPDGTEGMTLTQMKRVVGNFIDDALQGRSSVKGLDPITRVSRAARKDAVKLRKARKVLEKGGLGHMADDFDFLAQADIKQAHIENLFIADQMAVQSPETLRFVQGMDPERATVYGKRHAALLHHNVTEDAFGRFAVERLAYKRAGAEIPPNRSARALVEHKSWDWVAPDLRLKYPDAANDVEAAERYLNEVLEPEVGDLLRTFLEGKDAAEQSAILARLADKKIIETTVGGDEVVLNFNNNFGGVAEKVGELVADTAHDATVVWPEALAPVRGDPRFTEIKPTVTRRLLALFGDDISQALNRRPAWVREQRRWRDIFKRFGVPDELAAELSIEKATYEVNSVFFNPDTAPHLVQKLNRFIPFFKAFYEVMGQWTYKMPVAVGGNWLLGAPEFTRKIQRIMDTLVDTGMATRAIDDNGELTYTANVGDKTFNLGDPLDPDSFGALSFLQFSVGLNPLMQAPLSLAVENIPSATDTRRDVALGDESLYDMAGRLGVSLTELIRLNRDTLVNLEEVGNGTYLGLKTGDILAKDVVIPKGTPMRLPQSSLWAAITEFAMPFGSIEFKDLPASYMPAQIKNVIMGLGLNYAPADEAWQGDFGIINHIMPEFSVSSLNSSMAESFMYQEAHDRQIVDGKDMGPLERIQYHQAQMEAEADLDRKNELKVQLDVEIEDYLERVKEHAAGSWFTKGILGYFTPTSPQAIRPEAEKINQYWASREYAEQLQTQGDIPIQNFSSVEEIDQFWEMVGEWLYDPTGEGAKAAFARNNPTLLAYLTPKTFYGPEGPPPDINAFQDYAEQVKSGERVVGTAAITSNRYTKASIDADFNNEYIAKYGNDPVIAAASAISDRQGYREMSEARNDRYMAMYWMDDIMGNQYENWIKERYQDDNYALDEVIERRRDVTDALASLLQFEEDLNTGLDIEQLRQDASVFRRAIAVLNENVRDLEDLQGRERVRNPFEKAYNDYFTKVYIPYNEGLSSLWDEVEAAIDSEKTQMIFEKIRDYQNEFTNATLFTDLTRQDAPFITPLEFQWLGKDPEEQDTLRQVWLTRPLSWMNLHQAIKIIEHNPGMTQYLPSNDAEMEVYSQYTQLKVSIDESYEANQIGQGDRDKLLKQADEWLRNTLLTSGRAGEVEFLDMTPYQKLGVADLLPYELREYSPHVEWFIEALKAEGLSADSDWGRNRVAPLIAEVTLQAEQDPEFSDMLVSMGQNMIKKSRLDQILPWLFFDAKER